MGSSKIEIANNALGELGEPPLTSLSQVSLAAETVNLRYDRVIEDLLGKVDWRFAIVKATLSQEVGTPLNEWTYIYVLPPQFMRLVKLYPKSDFEIYSERIYTDAPSLACDYVKRVDEAVFPQTFARLAALELAVRCCMTIVGDKDLKEHLQQETRVQMGAAMAADAMQRPNRKIEHAPFVNCRF